MILVGLQTLPTGGCEGVAAGAEIDPAGIGMNGVKGIISLCIENTVSDISSSCGTSSPMHRGSTLIDFPATWEWGRTIESIRSGSARRGESLAKGAMDFGNSFQPGG
jgi:hypothetical protein